MMTDSRGPSGGGAEDRNSGRRRYVPAVSPRQRWLLLARKKIRVNCIAPGLVRTDFARALWQDQDGVKRAIASYPIGRLGEPEDLAGPLLFLASKASDFYTGHILYADGGYTAG